jgi:hypothetical protein
MSCACKIKSSALKVDKKGYWAGSFLIPTGDSCADGGCPKPLDICQPSDALCYQPVEVIPVLENSKQKWSSISNLVKPDCVFAAFVEYVIPWLGPRKISDLVTMAHDQKMVAFYVDVAENMVYFYKDGLPCMSEWKYDPSEDGANNLLVVSPPLFGDADYQDGDPCGLHPPSYMRYAGIGLLVLLIVVMAALYLYRR